MGKHRAPPRPSASAAAAAAFSDDRRQWDRIFKTMVELMQSQQSQIETLADERKFLEKYIHLQHDHWTSRARRLESHVSQLKKEEAMARRIQAAKIGLAVELKEREAVCYKKQYELAMSDCDDIHACVEALSAELSELKEKLSRQCGNGSSGVTNSVPVGNARGAQSMAALEAEIRKLKHSYKKLNSSKEAEVLALLAEKNFVWNQLNIIESNYIATLKKKKAEVENANEAIKKLHEDLEKLQKLVNDKDEMIADLKASHELDMRRHAQEAEQANQKIEQLQFDKEKLCSQVKEMDETVTRLNSEKAKLEMDMRNCINTKSRSRREPSANSLATPSESKPRRGRRKCKSEGANLDASQKQREQNSSKSRPSAPFHGLVQCSSKRKTRSHSLMERPPLFHSKFKVPKLMNSPSHSFTQ